MAILQKFLSRRLLVLAVFGFACPIVFKSLGVDVNITLASLGLAAAYMGQRALKG